MLLSLHGVIIWGFDTPLQKALLLCHYGLFLVWQPVWRARKILSLQSTLLFLAGGSLLIFFINWWLVAFWLAGLFGLLGGRVFSSQAKGIRTSYLLAASYMLAVLLVWVVPKLLNASADLAVTEFVVFYLLPLLPLTIFLVPAETLETGNQPILDFFYTLLLMLLAMTLVLGSYAIQASSQANYLEILLRVIFGLAIMLLLFSWLWNPRAGFTGIGQLLSGYLLSVGLPFEQWVKSIAELADKESSPKEFTLSAMREIAALPWVSGVTWDTYDSRGELGTAAKHQATLGFHEFHLSLYTRWPLTPALMLHIKLLTQIVGEFYEAKRREEALSQNTYMQAVYETGSRLTHDIKNLVQSLSALCTAAENSSDADNERLLALIRRQLPQLNQRLALTLIKLEVPRAEANRQVLLTEWWENLQQRHSQTNITFIADALPEQQIDAEVLDSVVDNLLQNAIEKARSEPDIKIEVEISLDEKFCLEICDSGKAMSPTIAEQLFKKHISSDTGLGIGLYHAARQAQQAGYRLSLAENKDGNVRFRLSRDVPS
jgi:signal transduction histidine kinase